METRKYYDYQQAFKATWEAMSDEAFREHWWSEKLLSCNAVVYHTARYEILQSYSTVVAIYDTLENDLYVYGYYSATTAQHISKFCKLFVDVNHTTFLGEAMYGNTLAYGAGFSGVWKKAKDNSLFFRLDNGAKFDDCADGLFSAIAYHA